jgi:preprotein translocase subunit YajC
VEQFSLVQLLFFLKTNSVLLSLIFNAQKCKIVIYINFKYYLWSLLVFFYITPNELIIFSGVFMISSAFAQSAAGGAGGFSLQGLLPFVLIFIIFYFLLIRPQQKRVKQHKLMVESLKRGNKVLTAGGILGVVTKAVDGSETG